MTNNFWDDKYSSDNFLYWTNPNKYFEEKLSKLNPWKILIPWDWEWRNWVFAAKMWWEVFCFDSSIVWKQKAEKLANDNNVSLNYNVSSFEKLEYHKDSFDCILLTYLHFINHDIEDYNKYLDKYLKKDWIVILEWFSKKHLWRQWWPQNIDMLFDFEIIKKDFHNYEVLELEEKEVILDEWKWHNSESIVIRFFWKKKTRG